MIASSVRLTASADAIFVKEDRLQIGGGLKTIPADSVRCRREWRSRNGLRSGCRRGSTTGTGRLLRGYGRVGCLACVAKRCN